MHDILSTRGISTLSLLILLLVSGIIGAALSYLWTEGYYVKIGHKVPEGVTTVTITNVTFPLKNSSYFDVTVLNPSYSKAGANITGIAMIVTTNDTDMIYESLRAESIEPRIPYPLEKGKAITFRCNRNWGKYAGQNVTVAIFVKDGSGATKSYKTEFVKLEIAEFAYNTAITISQFNITVRNRSNISLDVSEIYLAIEKIQSENISVNGQPIQFPYRISENESKVFTCRFPLWDAEVNSGYLGTTNDITVGTLQGYSAVKTETFSNPVILTLSNVTYPQLNTTQFILRNDPQSPHHVNLSNVTISVGNETFTINTNVTTGYTLEKGFNVTILCEDERLNWDDWKGEKMTIRVYTTQGFLAKKEEIIPSE